MNMPGMNDWEFLKEYTKLPEDQKGQIVIAMLTSSNNPDDQQRAQEKNSLIDFISKPLTKEKLDKVITDNFPVA